MIAFLVSSAFAAETWWVPDTTAAEALAAAAAAEWPSEEHRVIVGERPIGTPGWTWDGRTLVHATAGEVRTAEAKDADVAMLLGRTWAVAAPPLATPTYVPAWVPPLDGVLAKEKKPEKYDDGRTRWALALHLGTRSAVPEPFPLQGARAALSLERGHVWTSVDGYAGFAPIGRADAVAFTHDGVATTSVDTSALGFNLGWRGVSPVYGVGWVGPQWRTAENMLIADGGARSFYSESHVAGLVAAGAGISSRHFRAELTGWGRVTDRLPVSAGINLDGTWVIFGARRKPAPS